MRISAATFSFARCFDEGTMDIAVCMRACNEMELDAIELNDGYVASDEMTPADMRAFAAQCGL